MQALQITRHGPPAELRARELPAPPLGPGEVRVEIRAAGVNPSDVGSAEGRFPGARLPRVLGRDFAGVVTEGPEELLGAPVWGTGGDLGLSRDGTHAEQIVLPANAVARRPPNVPVERAAAVGVPFVAAWSALVDLGALGAGAWVVVSGAAGAVGGAAIEIAAVRGAHVVALVLNGEEAERIDRTKVAAVARSDRNDLTDVVRQATDGRGADLALNGVGSVIFQPMLDALADGGRMVVYSAAAGRDVSLDLATLLRRRLRLLGLSTAVLDATQGARILGELGPLFASGALAPPAVLETFGLSEAARAYERVEAGAPGKIVLVPDRYRAADVRAEERP